MTLQVHPGWLLCCVSPTNLISPSAPMIAHAQSSARVGYCFAQYTHKVEVHLRLSKPMFFVLHVLCNF